MSSFISTFECAQLLTAGPGARPQTGHYLRGQWLSACQKNQADFYASLSHGYLNQASLREQIVAGIASNLSPLPPRGDQ
jgi:hypothetical protein